MKYYHLIYNSSARSIKGATGFDIHTHSEDMPQEIATAIKKSEEIKNFKYKGASLTPATLSANPEAITGVIPTWIYAILPLGDGQKVHVLGREIAVGFDYSFYETGQPTRLGNFVGDFYLSLETPSADFWNLMYTRESGTQFLPASPIPTTDNEDMKRLSLGTPQLLPPMSEIEATAPRATGVHPYALEIVFAIIEARKLQKPLLINLASAGTADILADVFRLLPTSVAVECPFLTNYHEQGRRQGYNIFVINESYRGMVVAGMWLNIDPANGKVVQSTERDTFLPILQAYAERGEWSYAQNTLLWILSDAYARMGNSDPKLNAQVLSYLNNDKFDFEQLSRNATLRQALVPILQKETWRREYLFQYLRSCVARITASGQIKAIAQELATLEPLGADVVAKEWKPVATKIAFESSEAFVALHQSVAGNLKSVAHVIDFAEAANHTDYLRAFAAQPSVWRTLRPLFMPKAAENLASFVLFAIQNGFGWEDLVKAVEEVDPDKSRFVDSLIQIYDMTAPQAGATDANALMTEIHKKVRTFIGNTINYVAYYPFLTKAPGKYDTPVFVQLYLWDIQKKLAGSLANISVKECAEAIQALALVLKNVPALQQEIQQARALDFNATKISETVANLYAGYNTIIARDRNKTHDATIVQEIDSLFQILGVSTEFVQNQPAKQPLAKALKSLLNTRRILTVDTACFSVEQLRQAIEVHRIEFVQAALPILLAQKLTPADARLVATDCVQCGAISADTLLQKVKKPEYEQNRKAVWTIVLQDLNLKPTDLVQKIAGLYEEPIGKGKYSQTAIDQALRFMEKSMPEEYAAWDRIHNTLPKKIWRFLCGMFKKKSSKKTAKKIK